VEEEEEEVVVVVVVVCVVKMQVDILCDLSLPNLSGVFDCCLRRAPSMFGSRAQDRRLPTFLCRGVLGRRLRFGGCDCVACDCDLYSGCQIYLLSSFGQIVCFMSTENIDLS